MSTAGRPGVPASRRNPELVVYDLRLYTAGHSPGSIRAIENLAQLCQEHLAGRHRIEHVDLSEYPHRAREDGIIAVPTLIRRHPLPVRTIIGDLSDTRRTLIGLDLQPAPEPTP
jgi:circadian clock protein KaiB